MMGQEDGFSWKLIDLFDSPLNFLLMEGSAIKEEINRASYAMLVESSVQSYELDS